jgi:hypothetical protein
LSRLRGLKRLHVSLDCPAGLHRELTEEAWRERKAEMLTAMKKITAPSDFVLYLSDKEWLMDVDLGDSKCVFKLSEQGSVGSLTT